MTSAELSDLMQDFQRTREFLNIIKQLNTIDPVAGDVLSQYGVNPVLTPDDEYDFDLEQSTIETIPGKPKSYDVINGALLANMPEAQRAIFNHPQKFHCAVQTAANFALFVKRTKFINKRTQKALAHFEDVIGYALDNGSFAVDEFHLSTIGLIKVDCIDAARPDGIYVPEINYRNIFGANKNADLQILANQANLYGMRLSAENPEQKEMLVRLSAEVALALQLCLIHQRFEPFSVHRISDKNRQRQRRRRR